MNRTIEHPDVKVTYRIGSNFISFDGTDICSGLIQVTRQGDQITLIVDGHDSVTLQLEAAGQFFEALADLIYHYPPLAAA